MLYVASTFQHVKCKWMVAEKEGGMFRTLTAWEIAASTVHADVWNVGTMRASTVMSRDAWKKWYGMSKVSFREMKIILNQVARALSHHLPAFPNYRSGCARHYSTLSLCPLPHSLSEFEQNFWRIILPLSRFYQTFFIKMKKLDF